MKKWLITLALGSIFAFSANSLYAWGGNGNGWCRGGNGQGYHMGYGGQGYGHLVFLKEEVGLSEEQVDKVIKIDSEFNAKYYKNRGDYDKIEALRTEHRKAVEAVLTPDQKKKLDEFNGNRNGRWYGYCPWR